MSLATLLLLADGRFPSGGHAHSSGLEAAVAAGRVTGGADLEHFLRGRLATAGPVAASFAAATHLAVTAALRADPETLPAAQATGPVGWAGSGAPDVSDCLGPRWWAGRSAGDAVQLLDAELDARTASPALRLASRRQGRALLRAGRATWPATLFDQVPRHPDGYHHPVALGLTAAAAGLAVAQTALLGAYGIVTGPASAAVRLLGLDPYRTQALLARLAGACEEVARAATARAALPPAQLPASTAPLADISAEIHATWEVRLFAS